MNHTKVFKGAWHMVWRYRVLWVFGIVLALTTTSGSAAAWIGRDEDGDRGGLVYVLPSGAVADIGGYDGDRKGEGGDLILNYKGQPSAWPLKLSRWTGVGWSISGRWTSGLPR